MDSVIDESNAILHQGGFVGGCGGFYVRPFNLAAGQRKPGHQHKIDHVGDLLEGHARVHWRSPSGESGVIDMQVPAIINVPADHWHEIEAVTALRWRCWFAKAEFDRVYGADTIDENWHGERDG